MARPSGNTDQKLLKAGRELIEKEGLSRLSLRAVAKRAGVNLGMFHYHFKNKAEFSRRCTNEAYAEFYKGFETQVSEPGGTIEKLRRGLLALARFSRDQRHFMLAMLRDLEDKNPEAWDFIRSKFPPPHGKVIMGLIKQGQREGFLLKIPAPTAMAVLMSAIGFPNILAGLAERVLGSRLLSLPKLALHHYFLSDSALQLRVNLALRALMLDPPKDLRRWK
jgi:AcrR family transcriptional regulator